MDTCLACQVAQLRRVNAIAKETPGSYNFPRFCEPHGELNSRREANALLRTQALHEATDAQCDALEKARRASGHTLESATVPRRLCFPLGPAPGKVPLQGQVYRPALQPFNWNKTQEQE